MKEVTKCKSEIVDVDFGDNSVNKVCGMLEDSSDSSVVNSLEEQKYNTLFQRMGNNPKIDGRQYNEEGRGSCEVGEKGMFTVQVGGKEFLGLCDQNNSFKKFMIVTEKNSGFPKIEVCSGNCFEQQEVAQGRRLDTSKKIGDGKSIKFKKVS